MKKRKRNLLLVALLTLALSICACSAQNEEIMEEVENEAESEDSIEEAENEAESEDSIEEEKEESLDIIPDSYAYSIRVTINPQILLYLDADDKVVGIAYENEDAIDAYSSVQWVGLTLDTAIDTIINHAYSGGYIKEEGEVRVSLTDVGDATVVTDDSVLTKAKDAVNASLETIETSVTVNTEIAQEVQDTYSIERTMITCPTCGGNGIYCPGDHTTPGVSYDGCGGAGITACRNPICNGGKCTMCGGSGRSACPGCHGAGVNSVDGATCNHCGGSGTNSCEYCHGSGNCDRCGGSGIVTCYVIDRHTECADCDGTGLVEE